MLYLETSGDVNPGWYRRRGMSLHSQLRVAGSEGLLYMYYIDLSEPRCNHM